MIRICVGLGVVLAFLPAGAQSPTPKQTRLNDVVPADVRTTQLALTPDAQRVYYGDSARAIWFYDRSARRSVRMADGEAWDLTVSPAGNALAYVKTKAGSSEQHVWVLPLDTRTGLASGPERRASAMQGDSPSISADGKSLAFAADDSIGVGQSVVVVPVAGGRERTIVPFLRSGVTSIRWAPDGGSLFFSVNPPVACNPDWSCLPLRAEFNQTTGTVRRVSVNGGTPVVVAPKVGGGWPGLSTDGSLLVYSDTGFPSRVIVADTNGARLQTFALPPRQTMEGWLNASTLVFSDRGDVRRLRSYSLVDGTSKLLVDSLELLAEPAASPDGQLISVIDCGTDHCDLRITHADGSLLNVVALPDRYGGGNLGGKVWSPDQRWIAYIGGPVNGDRHLNAVEVSTGRVVSLATIRTTVASLLWSSDSRGVVVSQIVGGPAATRRLAFERVGLDGQVRQLREFVVGTPPSGGSPIDGSTAVLIRDGEARRVVFDGDSTDARLFAQTPPRLSSVVNVAPGGDRLAFKRSRDTTSTDLHVLEVMSSDGSGRVTIDLPFPMFSGANTVRFLPGAAQLIVMGVPFENERDVGVYLVTVATKAVKKLFTIPPSAFTGDLAVSSDGRTILYVSRETAAPRVFTMDLSFVRPGGRP